MKKLLLKSMLFLMLIASQALAQDRVVTGTVTAKEDGLPLPGVTVKVKGATIATQTDADGKYIIKVPAANNTLQFSFIGYTMQELAISDGVVNVSLTQDTKQLIEVVVTALGISKQEKTLGYAATTVKSDELTAARNVNVMSGIQGKVAGVAISNAGAAGASTKVVIRGVSSFSAGNNPLYIVDGVPINNITLTNDFTANTDKQFSRSADFGNQSNDINPDDVESVTILKGASATALYGSRAAHGVVMITTKKGQMHQKLKVSYTGALNFSNILRTPQTQNVFGQGWPLQAYEENGSWGPKFTGLTRDWGTKVNGVRLTKPYSYVENNIRDFFETGYDLQNSVSISGGGQNNSFVFSYSNTAQNGVVPTNADKFTRNNFSLRGDSRYGKFGSSYSVSYIRRDMRAVFAGQGTSDGGATVYQELINIPVDIPIKQLKDYKNTYNNVDNYFTVYAENPYFVVNENGTQLQDDRVFGKLELSYQLFNGLKAIGRLGGDFNNTKIRDWGAVVNFSPGSHSEQGEKSPTVGRYGENYRKDGQIDANLLLQGDYKLNADITLGGVIGYNYNQRKFTYLDSYVSGLNVSNWYSLQNTSSTPVTSSLLNQRRLMAALGNLDFGFRDYWFVNVSLRNDWSSTLPKDNRSYFYWGANSSLLLTDLFKEIQTDKLNFLKLRAAWGQTGNDAAPYRVNTSFIPSKPTLPFGDIFLPLNGVAGLSESNNKGNPNLKPEITTEWELGLDTRWFNNRIGLDISYYNRETKDQIIRATVPAETGYTTRTLNIGNIKNAGIEARLSLVPVKTTNFKWEFATNFTKNNSKVLKLYGDAKEYVIENAYSVDYIAEVGKPLGIYRVPAIQYVESGPMAGKVIVQANGRPKINPNAKEEVGSSNPDFILGFSNGFTYKNFSLNAVIDWRKGGKFYSYTKQLNNFVGNSTETTFNERQPFLVPNSVKEVVDGDGNVTYVENNIAIPFTSVSTYWNGNDNPAKYKDFVLDRDYVKLREVVLTYSLPKNLVSKAKLSAVDISLIGRNLLLLTPKSNNFLDPEGTNYGNDISSEFGEFAAAPTMRSFGASVRVSF